MEKFFVHFRIIAFHLMYFIFIVKGYLFGFWIAYTFRKIIRAKQAKSLWYRYWYSFLDNSDSDDDSQDYGPDWWLKAKGITKKNIWTAARWQLFRNPCYNIHFLWHPHYYELNDQTTYVIVSYHGEGLWKRDGGKVNIMEFARMRWYNVNGGPNSNTETGNGIDWVNTIMGDLGVYYSVKGRLYYHYSKVYESKPNIYKTFKYGSNGRRYLIQRKRQPNTFALK